MVTGRLYRIAVLPLWVSLCSNPALTAPCDKAGAQAQGRPRIGLVLVVLIKGEAVLREAIRPVFDFPPIISS